MVTAHLELIKHLLIENQGTQALHGNSLVPWQGQEHGEITHRWGLGGHTVSGKESWKSKKPDLTAL